MDPTPERWRRIAELFEAALELESAARAAYLADACGDDVALRHELHSLLRSAEATGAVEALAEALVHPLLARIGGPLAPGERVGPFRILRELGQGGMGAVFLAERDDPELPQRVALKLLGMPVAGVDMHRRFRRERQILARLEHPNIARLLDGGVAEDGRPYFAMEYVDGLPIGRYCDAARLDIPERLALFGRVCAAVQYAHQNLVVHRDIKPSNILVTADGQPKLLDFGIAKLLDPEDTAPGPDEASTRTATRFMTVEYASPEQIRGEAITTASDVYSLGVVLYELLTGRRPYRARTTAPHELARAICEDEPERPSSTVSRLAGDLDTILLKALEKEPARRYASAQQLLEDLRRHAEGLPVLARKDTLGYRAAKFVRRNRVWVAAAAIVALSLVAGAAAALWQAGRATALAREAAAERDRARLEATKAERVSAFLIELFRVTDPAQAQGRTVTADELLERGAARIEQELADQPEVQATMLDVVGQVYRNLGRYDLAEPLLLNAFETRKRVLPADHEDIAVSLSSLGGLRGEQGRFDESEALYRDALELYRRVRTGPDPELATALRNVATLAHRRGELDAAETMLREVIDMRRALPVADSAALARAFADLAFVLNDRERFEESDSLYREAIDIQRIVLGDDHPERATTLNNHATLILRRGDAATAEPMLREVLDIRRRVLGDDHPEVGRSLNNLAALLERTGDLAGAEPLYREALEQKRRTLEPDHPSMAISLNNLGLLLRNRGQLAAADPLFRESLEIRRKAYGPRHPAVATALNNLGSLRAAQGDTAAAIALYREALAANRETLGETHTTTLGVMVSLGRLLSGAPEAERLLTAAYEGLRAARGEDHASTQATLRALEAHYERAGRGTAERRRDQ